MFNGRRFDVNIMSIHRKENIDKFPRHSDVLFRFNIDGQKPGVTSTYFLRQNFNGEKSTLFISIFWMQLR